MCHQYLGGGEGKSHPEVKVGVCAPRVDPQVPEHGSQDRGDDKEAAHNKTLLHNWKVSRDVVTHTITR